MKLRYLGPGIDKTSYEELAGQAGIVGSSETGCPPAGLGDVFPEE